MYDTILEQIPTTIKHEERKGEINKLLRDSGEYPQLSQRLGQLLVSSPKWLLRDFARVRGEQEAGLIAALKANNDAVAHYTMMPDERIAERLSYLAMDIESEFHTATTAAGVIVLTWDTFPDAYVKRMSEYIDDIASLDHEPTEEEQFWDRADWQYQQHKEDNL